MIIYLAYRDGLFSKAIREFNVDEDTGIEDILEVFGAKKVRNYDTEDLNITTEEWFGKKKTSGELKERETYILVGIADMKSIDERFRKVNETELCINEAKNRRVLNAIET